MSLFSDTIRGVGTSLSDRIRGLNPVKQTIVNPIEKEQEGIKAMVSDKSKSLKEIRASVANHPQKDQLIDFARKSYFGATDFAKDSTKKALGLIQKKEMTVLPQGQPQEPLKKDPLIDAIAYNETGVVPEEEKYSFSQPSGNKKLGKALGKYQVTEGELKSYAPRYLGRTVTADEFLSSPEIQDEYMRNKITKLKEQGNSTEDIFRIHRGGVNAKPTQYGDYVRKGLDFVKSIEG